MAYDFGLTEEQIILRKEIRRFAENIIKPQSFELDEKEEFSVELTKEMGKLGLFSILVPETYGGCKQEYLSYIISIEEISRIDGSQGATLAAGNSLGICPILTFGNEEQKRKYLPKLCTGEALWGFGLTESDAGSDAQGTKTTAVFDGNEWILNGSKIFITNASTEISIGSTILAITGKRNDGSKELSCFLVENGTRGFEVKPMKGKMMWRASNTSELYFTDCRIKKEQILGKQGDGFKQMMITLDRGRLAIAAMGVGCAQGAFELALNYAKERKQFGKPISKFQAISFKLADIEVGIETARTYLYNTCKLLESNIQFTKESAIAKLYCSEVAHFAVDACVQILGGYGLMKEYGAEKFYRDQKLLEIGEGTSEIQRLVISRMIGC
jgi:alkylation response protein AidB-like acyl-CoA dehydrogenase